MDIYIHLHGKSKWNLIYQNAGGPFYNYYYTDEQKRYRMRLTICLDFVENTGCTVHV